MANENTAGAQKGRILLADDDAGVRDVMKIIFKPQTYILTEVETGKEAVQMYFSAPQDYDMVILDIDMPELRGDDAFRQIAQKFPGTEGIIYSGGARPPAACPGAHYVQKPFKTKELLQLVEEIIQRRRSRGDAGSGGQA